MNSPQTVQVFFQQGWSWGYVSFYRNEADNGWIGQGVGRGDGEDFRVQEGVGLMRRSNGASQHCGKSRQLRNGALQSGDGCFQKGYGKAKRDVFPIQCSQGRRQGAVGSIQLPLHHRQMSDFCIQKRESAEDASLAWVDAGLATVDALLAREDARLARVVARVATADASLEREDARVAREDGALATVDASSERVSFCPFSPLSPLVAAQGTKGTVGTQRTRVPLLSLSTIN